MKLWPFVLVFLVAAYLVDQQVYRGQFFGALKSVAQQIAYRAF